MRFLLIPLGLIGIASAALAREVLLKDGLSPDKRLGAYLVTPDHPEAGAAEFPSVVIRREHDRHVIGSFASGSYMAYFDPAYERTKVAWSADSQLLAILSQATKTTYEVSVYHLTKQGLTLIRLPDYGRPLFERLGIARGGRHFLLTQASWRAHDLQLRVSGNLSDSASNPTDFPNDWFECTVVLRVQSETQASVNEIEIIKRPK